MVLEALKKEGLFQNSTDFQKRKKKKKKGMIHHQKYSSTDKAISLAESPNFPTFQK